MRGVQVMTVMTVGVGRQAGVIGEAAPEKEVGLNVR
jgi:hypothetical protein